MRATASESGARPGGGVGAAAEKGRTSLLHRNSMDAERGEADEEFDDETTERLQVAFELLCLGLGIGLFIYYVIVFILFFWRFVLRSQGTCKNR